MASIAFDASQADARPGAAPLDAVRERVTLGVTASTAYYWMKGARGAAAPPQFARLVSASSLVPVSLVGRVYDATVRVETGFDAELLRAVVSALGGRVA